MFYISTPDDHRQFRKKAEGRIAIRVRTVGKTESETAIFGRATRRDDSLRFLIVHWPQAHCGGLIKIETIGPGRRNHAAKTDILSNFYSRSLMRNGCGRVPAPKVRNRSLSAFRTETGDPKRPPNRQLAECLQLSCVRRIWPSPCIRRLSSLRSLPNLEAPEFPGDCRRYPRAGTTGRFYRPELDALRFFAFLAVLVHHGPASPGFPDAVRRIGGFGLSMFFLLSAYLITELLFRERDRSGTVACGLFFIRRSLRIWPLYFAALVVGIVVSGLLPRRFGISLTGVAAMCFFVANQGKLHSQLGFVLSPLWSISIEEQFYLIWPPIVKLGGMRLAFAASIVFSVSAAAWIWVFSSNGWALWYETPVEFLFFAAGAILAVAMHGKPVREMSTGVRGGLLTVGLFSLAVAAQVGGIGTANVPGLTRGRLCIGYSVSVAGCVLIFSAVLGASHVPRVLSYLGRISYGLYVFHSGVLQISLLITAPLTLAPSSVFNMLMVDAVALAVCIPAAHLSYMYFERPFLRLKERFEVIASSPV